MGDWEYEYRINRVLTSNLYFFIVINQLIVSTVLTIYVLVSAVDVLKSKLVLSFEIVLALFYSLDILLRMMKDGCKYFQNFYNIIDILVYLLILAFFYHYSQFLEKSTFLEEEDYIPFSLLTLRYIVLIIRLITIYNRSKEIVQIHKNNMDLDISQFSDEVRNSENDKMFGINNSTQNNTIVDTQHFMSILQGDYIDKPQQQDKTKKMNQSDQQHKMHKQ